MIANLARYHRGSEPNQPVTSRYNKVVAAEEQFQERRSKAMTLLQSDEVSSEDDLLGPAGWLSRLR